MRLKLHGKLAKQSIIVLPGVHALSTSGVITLPRPPSPLSTIPNYSGGFFSLDTSCKTRGRGGRGNYANRVREKGGNTIKIRSSLGRRRPSALKYQFARIRGARKNWGRREEWTKVEIGERSGNYLTVEVRLRYYSNYGGLIHSFQLSGPEEERYRGYLVYLSVWTRKTLV